MEPIEIAVASLEQIPPGGMTTARAGPQTVLLCRVNGHVFSVRSSCPHRGAPLVEGKLEGALLRCPWHGARFDVRTGSRVCVPECKDLTVFPSRIADGQVWVAVPAAPEK